MDLHLWTCLHQPVATDVALILTIILEDLVSIDCHDAQWASELLCWPQQVLNGSSSAAAAPSSAAKEAEQVDYATWPIKELRRFLTERGVDASGIVEKADLVAQVTMPALY